MERIDITPPHNLAILTACQASFEYCVASLQHGGITDLPRSTEYNRLLAQYEQVELLLRRYAYVLTDDERRVWEQHNGTINKINREEERHG